MTNPSRLHRVRAGDTLSSIATLEQVSVNDLAKINGIANINRIKAGQLLRIPQPSVKREARIKPSMPASGARTVAESSTKQVKSFDEWVLEYTNMTSMWLDEVLSKMRLAEANERVQKEESFEFSKSPKQSHYRQKQPKDDGSLTILTIDEVKRELKKTLAQEPHITQFKGVKLTQNEKKQIIAAVSLCEMNELAFASMNSDQEFVGRKNGTRGIETSYSRIVHIGLSYGVIQYTQDSGSLGALLSKMREKNAELFTKVFGDGDAEIANSLITLTTTGRSDLVSESQVPISGQAHWQRIRKTPQGREIATLANSKSGSLLPTSREIRGKRVQPIPPLQGAPAIDIWTGAWKERFLKAGQAADFQEAQIELAVSNYFNRILPRAKANKVRSALSLAFIAACAVRGGPTSKLSRLFYEVASAIGLSLPFTNSDDERKCLNKIADTPIPSGRHTTTISGVTVDIDEIRRAKLLRKDELGFLAEDLYDTDTYI